MSDAEGRTPVLSAAVSLGPLTLLAVALVCIAPGALFVAAVRAPLPLSIAAPVVPACSLGLVLVSAQIVDAIGIEFGPLSFGVLLAVLAAVAVWNRRRGDRGRWHLAKPARPSATAIAAGAMVVGSLVLGCVIWADGIGGNVTPPNFDAAYHGFMSARIADLGTVDPGRIVVSDPITEAPAADWYPLALHATAALVHRISGAPMGELLNTLVVFYSVGVFVTGTYALARLLSPVDRLAAGFASIAAVTIALFPWKPIGWGGISLIVANSLVPGVVAATIHVTRLSVRSWSAATVTGAAIAGVVLTQSSAAVFLLLVVVALAVERALRQPYGGRVPALLEDGRRLAVVAVVACGVAALSITGLLAGTAERSDFVDREQGSLDAYLGLLLTLATAVPIRQGVAGALAAVGALVAVQRRVLGVVAAWAAVIWLALLAHTSTGWFARALTLPWYRQPERISYLLVLVVPLLVGLALSAACRVVATLRPRNAERVAALASVVVVAILIPVWFGQAVRTQISMVERFYAVSTPVDADSVAAFRWLADHVEPGEYVLSDGNADGAIWMHALAGVDPLFGVYSADPAADWQQRVDLRDRLPGYGTDATLDELLDRYPARFLYFDERIMEDSAHLLDIDAIRANPNFDLVASWGSVSVFELDELGAR